MVSQVSIVGILMIVNGALASIMGLVFAAIGPIMFTAMKADAGRGGMRAQDENVFAIMSVFYLAWGLLILACGVMNIIGGIKAMKYRSRTFVLVAIFSNILLMCSYCLVTSLGMLIYGLIVMFQSDVTRAFALGDEGFSAEEIKRRFAFRMDSYRDRDDDDYYEEERDRPRQLPPPSTRDSDFPPGDDRYK